MGSDVEKARVWIDGDLAVEAMTLDSMALPYLVVAALGEESVRRARLCLIRCWDLHSAETNARAAGQLAQW